jgi:hypothetical protein
MNAAYTNCIISFDLILQIGLMLCLVCPPYLKQTDEMDCGYYLRTILMNVCHFSYALYL